MTRYFLILTLLLITALGASQQPTAPDNGYTITIRVLNGKTGKPVKDEKPNVSLGDAGDPTNPATDSNGEIHLHITSRHRSLGFLPNYYVDCRYKKDQPSPNGTFSIDEIVSKGIVTGNLCGKAHIEPVPSVLVVYVRKMSFREKWEI